MDSRREELELILHTVPQPVWVIDHDGAIEFANPAAVTALGYTDLAELRGRPSHETVHHHYPDGSPFPAAECPMLWSRQAGTTVHEDEDWFFRRDGSKLPIAWWSSPLDLPNGRGAVLAFEDTTQRRAAEQAVRERDAARIRAAESRATGRRIVESAAAARRQVARDLHDGAQQRLVTLLIELQLAREELDADPRLVGPHLDEAVEQTRAAIVELRELAAGIHPAILTLRGLRCAVEALATRTPLPVEVTGSVEVPLPEAVEACAYFFAAEALTNAVKHSRASRVMVTIEATGPVLSVEVRDDGVGGAVSAGAVVDGAAAAGSVVDSAVVDSAAAADAVVDGAAADGAVMDSAVADRPGSGLAGLADRVDALGGRLTLVSPPGAGTTLRAEFPL
ncbi:PAS domain S-box protein [Amycolatopsis rhabdoformis]|uniref:histidine kinase n=1 Tax=Amycolatopsis rhabdoformis TaxID=1448059 RepID=A0ABZ1IBC5_9PSEU|nr:PAS domain S-box protein [Amycolatopsis rhabdoformis]WSE31770.1 PAS domain S-box protein [Amycolatopsis rhabdoformis]